MTIVVKIGGAAIEDADILRRCAQAVAEIARHGHRVVIVHGGGKSLSRTLERLGMKTEFVDGFRVTDGATRDVALMVLAGLVNKKLVAAVQETGIQALGLCGGDGMMFRARKKESSRRDLGFAGEVSKADVRWLNAIWNEGGVPVLASMTLGEDGEYYNVNADEMAAACAPACGAEMMVFLTDVAGVKDGAGNVITSLSVDEIASLIEGAVISGGMLPKLQACRHALDAGVKRVHILAAAKAENLPKLCIEKESAGERTGEIKIEGTEITRGEKSHASSTKPGLTKQGANIEYATAQ